VEFGGPAVPEKTGKKAAADAGDLYPCPESTWHDPGFHFRETN